jgi:hypothetical protein
LEGTDPANATVLPIVVSVDVTGVVNSSSSSSSSSVVVVASANVTMVVATVTLQGAKDVAAAVATIGSGSNRSAQQPLMPITSFEDVFVATEGAKGNDIPVTVTVYIPTVYSVLAPAGTPAAGMDLTVLVACGAGACVLVALIAGALVKRRGKRMDKAAVREAVDLEMGQIFQNPMGDRKVAARFIPPKDLAATVAPQARLKELEAEVAVLPLSVAMSAPQIATIDENFGMLRAVFDGAVQNPDEEAMRAVLEVQGKGHALAYFACNNLCKEEEGYDSLASSAEQGAAQFPAWRNGHRTCGQIARALPVLYEHARATLPLFEEQMRAIVVQFDGQLNEKGEAAAVKLHMSPLKGLYRCVEKMCLQAGERRYNAGCICDVVRCIIECDDCRLKNEVLRALLAAPGLRVQRVKVRRCIHRVTAASPCRVMIRAHAPLIPVCISCSSIPLDRIA